MKLLRSIAFMGAAIIMFGLTSCSDDDPVETDKTQVIEITGITFDTDDIWEGWNQAGNLSLGEFSFSHQWTEWSTSQGFVAAKIIDTDYYEPMYDHQFEVITAGGMAGKGTPYMVANWNSSESEGLAFADRSCSIAKIDGTEFTPECIYITNAAYAYYSMTRGDAYAKKFAKGDRFTLIAHGVTATGETTARFNLADCTTDNAEEGIVKTWEKFDLTPLGTVSGIYFTMESTDVGQWGMNTPAYFAADNFTVKK